MTRTCFDSANLQGGGSSTEKGGRREIKVREAEEQGTGGGRFWPPCPLPPPSPHIVRSSCKVSPDWLKIFDLKFKMADDKVKELTDWVVLERYVFLFSF